MRKKHPVGTLFRLYLYPRDIGAAPMLSARNSEYYEVVDPKELEQSNRAAKNKRSTFNKDRFFNRVCWLLANPTFLKATPKGNESPARKQQEQLTIQRSPSVAAWVRLNADGKCELCKRKAPFEDRAGLPFLEVHHVIALAEGGPDTIQNAVAVCPNCHRALHFSSKASNLEENLYSSITRLRKAARDI